jgi:ATP-binding cassette, subfamily C, type I secretion system permease/ATPase
MTTGAANAALAGAAPETQATPLALAVRDLKKLLGNVAVFSFFINLLILASPLYMLQIYDRVLTSKSGSTLVYLTLYIALALGTMAVLELVRSRVLVRAGVRLDRQLAPELFGFVLSEGSSGQPLRDLETVRTFATGSSILALLDAPWMPIFITAVFLLHPLLGSVAVAGALLLLAIGLSNEYASRATLTEAGKAMALGTQFAETSARNAEVIRAMGMLGNLRGVWRVKHASGVALQALASDKAGLFAAAAKFVRFGMQAAMLGAGAWLVLHEEITAGAMVAGSILMGRAVAPVELAIASWRTFVQARVAYGRLGEVLARGNPTEPTRLPVPQGGLRLDNVYWSVPGRSQPILAAISFALEAGQSLGVIGPSASGKSTLARLIVGVRTPDSGVVRLDNASIGDWPRELIGPHIGYLPQDIELFSGTVAQNICRFGEPNSQKIVAAAQFASAHDMIVELPKGYDTIIGHGGAELSGGQRQRIGLARALYGLPALVVLDEPTAHLDAEGEAAVRQALGMLKDLKRTVVVVAHRPTLIGGVDKIAILHRGTLASFGPAAEILPQITRKVVARHVA